MDFFLELPKIQEEDAGGGDRNTLMHVQGRDKAEEACPAVEYRSKGPSSQKNPLHRS